MKNQKIKLDNKHNTKTSEEETKTFKKLLLLIEKSRVYYNLTYFGDKNESNNYLNIKGRRENRNYYNKSENKRIKKRKRN